MSSLLLQNARKYYSLLYGQFPSKENFIAIQPETLFNPPHVQDTFMTEWMRQSKPFVVGKNGSFWKLLPWAIGHMANHGHSQGTWSERSPCASWKPQHQRLCKKKMDGKISLLTFIWSGKSELLMARTLWKSNPGNGGQWKGWLLFASTVFKGISSIYVLLQWLRLQGREMSDLYSHSTPIAKPILTMLASLSG